MRCRRFGVYFDVAVVVDALVMAGGLLVCWLLLAHDGDVWAAFGFNEASKQLATQLVTQLVTQGP